MNNLGDVAGYAQIALGNRQGILYSNGTMTRLGTLGDRGATDTEAHGINDANQVVGVSVTEEGPFHGFLYSDDKIMDLGILIGKLGYSFAYSINNAAQITGVSSITKLTYPNVPVLFWQDKIFDSKELFGVERVWVSDINDNYGANGLGQMVGYFDSQAFLYSNETISNIGFIVCPDHTHHNSTATRINNVGQILVECCSGPYECSPSSSCESPLSFYYDFVNKAQ